MSHIPSLEDIKAQAQNLAPRLYKTPVTRWQGPKKDALFGADTDLFFKLELLQKTGSFKARGALTVIDHMSAQEKARGVVAGTGGNHGVAVAFAAAQSSVQAKIIVPKAINAFRLAAIRAYGAEILEVDHISLVIDEMKRIAEAEQRTIMHPYENPKITLGAASLGLEFLQSAPDLDAVIIPIGGGGLCSGVSCAIKQANPACKIYGVEPVGANSMSLSFAAGHAVALPEKPNSIADSLSAPCAEDYSYSICQKFVDDLVLIEDDEMRRAMKLIFEDMKLAVEPAGAAATAALLGPLKERCMGKKIGVIICGSNIDTDTFYRHIGSVSRPL